MPIDITLCRNEKCPSFLICYRAQAETDWKYQSVAMYQFDEETGQCESFWPMEENKIE